MKKILFIIGTLQSGGVSKSLVNLLNVIDTKRYDIHLLVLEMNNNVHSTSLPKGVTVHVNTVIQDLHHGINGVFHLLKTGHFMIAIGSLLRMGISLFSKSYSGILLSKLMPCFSEEEFDTVIDYGGQQQLYYMVDKLKSSKKMSFFHSDYNKWPYYKIADKKYYPRIDKLFTISEKCVESLKEHFPEMSHKIFLFENITCPKVLYKLSEEKIDTSILNGTFLLTIGHVWYNKGTDLAVAAARILMEQGYNFTWLFIGKVADTKYVKDVASMNLGKTIQFLGIKSNPYPYMKHADIFVHPSRFEGKSIAIDEAKIMCKPIVATSFSTVNDQLINGVNATICEMTPDGLANAIKDLIDNEEKRNNYQDYLKNNIQDNSTEIFKLYNTID